MAKFDPNEYFLTLATQHKDIKHTTEEPAFFREYSSSKVLFDNSEFLKQMRYVKRIALVSQFNPDGNFFGPNSDSHFKNNSGALYVIMKMIDGNVQEVQDKTSEIADDIFTRIKYDSEEGIISQEYDVKLNDISIHSLGRIADNYFGLVLFISFTNPFCKAYDKTKWI